jgi:hypothetical protein
LALIAENYDYDWQTAEKEFRRAIQLDPDYDLPVDLTRAGVRISFASVHVVWGQRRNMAGNDKL